MGRIAMFVRATLLGGVLLLAPIVVLVMLLAKAHDYTSKLIGPMVNVMLNESIDRVQVAKVLSVAVLVTLCFVAGLIARAEVARRWVGWLESAVLGQIPGYNFIKNMGESVAGVETHQYPVILVRIEDAWQIAFLVERLKDGNVVVYVPGAPAPWSGNVFYMTEDRIKALDVPMAGALNCLKRMGVGSEKVVGGKL